MVYIFVPFNDSRVYLIVITFKCLQIDGTGSQDEIFERVLPVFATLRYPLSLFLCVCVWVLEKCDTEYGNITRSAQVGCLGKA